MPGSFEPDEAAHWVNVYSELVRFIRTGGGHWPPAARYERRLSFWRARLCELEERGSRFRGRPVPEERTG